MELTIRCCKCGRELAPAWVHLPKDGRLVACIDGECRCGRINTAWEGVSELAGIYGAEAVIEAANRLGGGK